MSQEQNLKIEEIIALFHANKPRAYKIEEIRNQETDSRWVIYVDFPNEKYVIKLASNSFTTTKRVNAWVDLIYKYQEMGYYSPMLQKSINNHYTEQIMFHDKNCIAWEEEFAKYHFMNDLDKSIYTNPDNKAEAAPILFKYILGIEYSSIEALENNLNDENKLTKLFDFMESELRREDIDFRKAMLKHN